MRLQNADPMTMLHAEDVKINFDSFPNVYTRVYVYIYIFIIHQLSAMYSQIFVFYLISRHSYVKNNRKGWDRASDITEFPKTDSHLFVS